MRQVLIFLFLGTLIYSCKKDKIPEPCTGIDMSERRSKMIGTWRCYRTWVNQTFASGNTYTFDYTPTTEGYNYYFTISVDGVYKGYRDSVLVHQHLMSKSKSEDLNHPNTQYLETFIECSNSTLRFIFPTQTTTFDTIKLWEYPIRFDDEIAKKHSTLNFFVKV